MQDTEYTKILTNTMPPKIKDSERPWQMLDIANDIYAYWQAHMDWSYGQLIHNLYGDDSLLELSDDELAVRARKAAEPRPACSQSIRRGFVT